VQTKLTLRMEETAIEGAKAWAKQHGVTLSATVQQFFERLSAKAPALPVSPWTLRLLGAAIGSGRVEESTNEQAREDYLDHAEAKYR
jgi:antitoxin component of RelBE/YafQ-DinJ toxin-antitoxin module